MTSVFVLSILRRQCFALLPTASLDVGQRKQMRITKSRNVEIPKESSAGGRLKDPSKSVGRVHSENGPRPAHGKNDALAHNHC